MKQLALILLAVLALSSCMDLDAILSPIVFMNEKLTSYEMENYTKAELYDEIQAAGLPAVSFSSNIVNDIDSNGNTLYGFHLYTDTNGATGDTILFFHGNYHHLDHYYQRLEMLLRSGWNVFSVDYRGFGMSEGEPSEQGLYEDGIAAWDYLVNTIGVAEDQILIYGYSLGSVPAVYVAAKGANSDQIAGLVLEAPIGSFELYVQDASYMSIPGNFISEYKLDNISTIKEVYPTVRFLWLHGTADETNQYSTHGQAVYNAFPGPNKYKKLVEGADHAGVPYVLGNDFSVYYTAIGDFANGLIPF